MRCPRLAVLAGLLVGGLLPAACTLSEPRYSADQLLRGVEIAVNDRADAAESATVFLPDELPSYLSFHPELEEQGVAVMQPGEGGYDVVVMYRTGPYCGRLPSVTLTGNRDQLEVEIRTKGGGDCDDMQYDEALGLELSPGFETATVTARQGG